MCVYARVHVCARARVFAHACVFTRACVRACVQVSAPGRGKAGAGCWRSSRGPESSGAEGAAWPISGPVGDKSLH